jgi:hypothetical protein
MQQTQQRVRSSSPGSGSGGAAMNTIGSDGSAYSSNSIS